METIKIPRRGIAFGVIALIGVLLASQIYQSVPPGHVAVATLFGKVVPQPYREGLHIPVNPLYDWHFFDARQKTHKETANVPSQDQLQTEIDVSIQYRLIAEMAPQMLKDTGAPSEVINVHLVPKVRSLLREQGKSIERAEDFFAEETQDALQVSIVSGLRDYLQPKGIKVQAVLIRDITLPPFITKAIESKKEREQEVQKQKAELERYRTEQQQKIAQAQAERAAAEEEAEKRRVLADARAYEIERLNEAIGSNPNYVKLQALEALQKISKDPASKIYFIDGQSTSPLPLMHLSEGDRK